MLSTPPAFILSQDQTLMFKFVLGHSKAWLFYNRFLLCLKSVHNFTSKKPLDSVLLHLAVWHSPNPPVIIYISSNKFDSPHLISSLLFLVFFKSFKVISLFSYQGSFRLFSSNSFCIISKLSSLVKNFFNLFLLCSFDFFLSRSRQLVYNSI